MNARTLLALALLAAACAPHEHGPGGHSHEHGGGHAQAEEAEEQTLAITRWTDRYELFVELTAPRPGAPIAYHAHVTRLSDFAAVTEGTFRVRFAPAGGGAPTEATQVGVKRPGIFVFEAPAPAAGTYAVTMSYDADTFDCGDVVVADPPAPAPELASGAPITFLKESQWKIPFGTAWAAERPLAREVELPATVEAAGADRVTLAAPIAGRFFHNAKLALTEGLRVRRGEVLGTLEPNVAGDDFARLQAAVEESGLAREQAQRELDRITPLVAQGLLPERRLVELRNALETQAARARAAGGRLSGVTSPGSAGGVVVRATIDGVVTQVPVLNGAPVDAAATLVELGGTDHLWLRARFAARPASSLVGAQPVAVRLADGSTVDLAAAGGRLLSPLPVVDPSTRLATWVADVAPPSTPADLRPGSSVVLILRVGEPSPRLALPRSAVVDINTRAYAFVQLDGEHFERRTLRLGLSDGPWVAVLDGVRPGERVVSRGGFDIHLATLMGTVESHRH